MKVALITGATRGIGLAIAEKFILEGIYVIGTYKSSAQIAADLQKKYGADKIEFHQLNLGQIQSHQNLLSKLTMKIDILVNNAGVGSKTVENITADKYDQDLELLRINALGPLWLCEALIEKMRLEKTAGKIINISSVGGGVTHIPGFRVADGMSKAALTFMTKQMAAELALEKIEIYAICPGATETDMFKASSLSQFNQAQQIEFVAGLPKQRLINPQEIAQLCYFLTTAPSELLHGAVLDASMGLGVNPCLINSKSEKS